MFRIHPRENTFEVRKGWLKGKIQVKKSATISEKKTYYAWTFESYSSKKQFYLEEHQKRLNKKYEKYLADKSQFETYLDLGDAGYIIDFKGMTQTNIETHYERPIKRRRFDLWTYSIIDFKLVLISSFLFWIWMTKYVINWCQNPRIKKLENRAKNMKKNSKGNVIKLWTTSNCDR